MYSFHFILLFLTFCGSSSVHLCFYSSIYCTYYSLFHEHEDEADYYKSAPCMCWHKDYAVPLHLVNTLFLFVNLPLGILLFYLSLAISKMCLNAHMIKCTLDILIRWHTHQKLSYMYVYFSLWSYLRFPTKCLSGPFDSSCSNLMLSLL